MTHYTLPTRAHKRALVFAAIIVLMGCQTLADADRALYETAGSVTQTDRITGARTLSLRDRQEQIAISRKAVAAELVDEAKQGKPYNEALDPVAYARLERVAKRVVKASHFSDEIDQWRVYLLADNKFNAHVYGGADIVVYKGLMDELTDDDRLAAVIGHEIAHNAANHPHERQASQTALALTNSSSVAKEGYGQAFRNIDEAEADRIGLLYMALAGYDPAAAAQVWRGKLAQNPGYSYFRVHPTAAERLAAAKETAQIVRQYYRPGQVNPNARDILTCNDLFCPSQNNVSPGEGGGLLALLEVALQTWSKHEQAKLELSRQRLEIARNKQQQPAPTARPDILVFTGDIQSGGEVVPIRTEFQMTDRGPTYGRYRYIQGGRTYDGELHLSHFNEKGNPVYRWRDPAGQGYAAFAFAGDGSAFNANWFGSNGRFGGTWRGQGE